MPVRGVKMGPKAAEVLSKDITSSRKLPSAKSAAAAVKPVPAMRQALAVRKRWRCCGVFRQSWNNACGEMPLCFKRAQSSLYRKQSGIGK